MSSNETVSKEESKSPFSAMAAFDEGRALSNGVKWPIQIAAFWLFLVSFSAYLALNLLPSFLIEANSNSMLIVLLAIAAQFTNIAITTPITTGFMLMGVNRAAGGGIDSGFLWSYFPQTGKLFLGYLLMALLMALGFMLLIIPGIYLSVAYVFAMPLIADKKMGVWQALETSRKTVSKHWFSYAGLILMLSLVNLLGVISLGIGLIWTIPWSINSLGVAYRDAFGFTATASESA
jgi:uncharacterized membrane protein